MGEHHEMNCRCADCRQRKGEMSDAAFDCEMRVSILEAALLELADASETFAGSDSDMSSWNDSECRFDKALEAARVALDARDRMKALGTK